MLSQRTLGAMLLTVAATGLIATLAAPRLWPTEPSDAAPTAEVLARGQTLYADYCAACHGAELQGAAQWQQPGPNGRFPAPPHDASGHTWHHDDDLLFRITKYGSAAVVGGGYQSDMIGFGDVLSDAEIGAVLAYIKSHWPERERAFQAELSRRAAGGR